MGLYSTPPENFEFKHDKPTLLVCWWVTSLCTCIILLRLAGRFIRTERLFPEDRIAALALIPLFLRMGCVHFILVHGTNNVDIDNLNLSPRDVRFREIASGLVLLSRILYAATLWILKNTILEFFRRLTDVTWERSYQTTLVAIRWVLIITFGAVIISDLAECQPFTHYWQVIPDPGGQCRQGYVQLLTTGICNIITDLLLVFFPIPIILRSNMKTKRKLQLTLLFSLSLGVVGVTLYRVPHVIQDHGRQQTRSLLASVELLFATAAANALVLGSFVRDRGLKKQKFRRASAADSFDRSSNARRPTIHRQWGSDEDLVRDVGMGVEPELQRTRDSTSQPAPAAATAKSIGDDLSRWQYPQRGQSSTERSDESLLAPDQLSRQDSQISSHMSPRKVSFFDVGGLLEESAGTSSGSYRRASHTSSTLAPDSIQAQPSPALPASSGGFRRGSSALLQDLGGLLGPRSSGSLRDKPLKSNGTELQTIHQSQHEQTPNLQERQDPILLDPGGLLK
jgi:hypothetical protein